MFWVSGVMGLTLEVRSEKMEGEERGKMCCRKREISSEETAGRVHVEEIHAFGSHLLEME